RLRVQVPVSLHQRSEGNTALGNRDSFLNVDLPVHLADPVARLVGINLETARRKSRGDPEELYSLFHALGRLGPVRRAGMHIAEGPREFSLSVSNVPGPGTPVTILGETVASLYSLAEPADRHALRVSAISLAGTV